VWTTMDAIYGCLVVISVAGCVSESKRNATSARWFTCGTHTLTGGGLALHARPPKGDLQTYSDLAD
jgi:hypothetical protein